MNTSGGPGRPLLILLVLLTISVLLDRYLIAGLFPWISMLGALCPMVVFLDIPLRLPVIDCIPVAVLFSLFFAILVASNPGRYGTMGIGDIRRRLGSLLGGVLILLAWMAAGALVYHFAWDYMPREVRNGIDSFGIQMDVYNPYPGHEILHGKGGMLLLICFIIGSRSLAARAGIAMRVVPAMQPAVEAREAAAHQAAPMASIPLAEPRRPRAVATKVPVVAPLRVESFE